MRRAPFIVACVLLLFAVFAGAAEAGTSRRPAPTFPEGSLEDLARLPDRDISFSGVLLRLSRRAGPELTGRLADTGFAADEMDRLALRLRAAIGDEGDPRRAADTVRRTLFDDEGFAYDPVAGDPDNYLIDRVLSRKRGNCLGLTSVLLALAERLDLPLHGAYVPSHCFARYEEKGTRVNFETAEGGTNRGDASYAREYRLNERRPYLRSLSKKEMIGVYLKSLGAAYSKRGREDRALDLYGASAAFYPGLPDAYFNAGASYQKAGRLDEAIGQYRRALALDPDLAVARDNLGVAYAKKGMFVEALEEARRAVAFEPWNAVARGNLAATLCACGSAEEGAREYRKALEVNPEDPRLRAGLAKAYFAAGALHEAAEACDRAMEVGCRFDASMLSALETYRLAPGGPRP